MSDQRTEKVRQMKIFFAGIILLGMASGMFETSFNNFLHDSFGIAADQRGFLEFPREFPGFITAVMAGLLFFLPETLIGAFAALCVGLGMLGLAAFGGDMKWMMVFMVIWSCGAHLMMPVKSSLAMHLAEGDKKGARLGQVHAVGIAGTIFGCGLVWLIIKEFEANYALIFLIGGIAAIVAAAVLAFMRLPGAHLKRPRFVFRKQYWLFYVLALLFGARKQMFITFGPWVLVKVFHQEAHVIAVLWIAAAVIGVFFYPLIGRIIDRIGERNVLMADSMCVLVVCIGYGTAHFFGNETASLWILYACYVVDHLLFAVNMARRTYLSRIAVKPEDIAPTLSLGITINHAVSMCVPALGGLLWMEYGHQSVFAAAAVIALIMMVFASMVRVPERQATS